MGSGRERRVQVHTGAFKTSYAIRLRPLSASPSSYYDDLRTSFDRHPDLNAGPGTSASTYNSTYSLRNRFTKVVPVLSRLISPVRSSY